MLAGFEPLTRELYIFVLKSVSVASEGVPPRFELSSRQVVHQCSLSVNYYYKLATACQTEQNILMDAFSTVQFKLTRVAMQATIDDVSACPLPPFGW